VLGLTANVINLGVAMNAIQVPAWMVFLMRIGGPLAALLLTGPAGQVTGDSESQEKQIEENAKRKQQYRREHPEYREPWERLKGLFSGGAPSPSGTSPAPGQVTGGGPPGALPWGLAPQLAPLPGTRSGGIGPLQIFPNLYTPSAAPGAPSPQGAVEVNVRFDNAPPGMRVRRPAPARCACRKRKSAMLSASSDSASPDARLHRPAGHLARHHLPFRQLHSARRAPCRHP
jgi:hypothetical protein